MRLNRIGVKLVLCGVAVLAVQVAVRSWIEYEADSASLRSEFLRLGRAQAQAIAQEAEYGLLTGDRAELVRVAERRHTTADQTLLYVAFYDEAGSLLAAKNWSDFPDLVPGLVRPAAEPHEVHHVRDGPGEMVRFIVPVAVSRQMIEAAPGTGVPDTPPENATIVCGHTYEPIRQAIFQDQKEMLWISGAVLVGGVGVWVLLGRWLARPIRRLAAGTERVAAGDLTTRVDVGRRQDELRALADAFNRMTERLQRQRRKILSYSEELEQKVEQRTAELAAVNRDLERELAERRRAEQELRRSNAELRQFAYVASHDLQEPLRMVTSYVQLLAHRYQGRLDEDADEFIAYAVDGAERMKSLINDVLEYSRVGRSDVPLVPVDCEGLLDDVLANLQLALAESGGTVTRDPLPTVLGDRHQLTCVFQNLVANALKFCTASPEIHVSAECDGDLWRLSVRDNGIGIAPEYRDRIFGVFQRLHGRDEYPGTGMGLAITKKIIERHGGTISLESEPGRGTTFSFTLRAVPAGVRETPAEAPAAAHADA